MTVIAVASHNPVKLQAALGGYQHMFPGQAFEVQVVRVSSGVGVKPRSNAETLKGAEHRAWQAAELLPDAVYWVGIEGAWMGRRK